MTHARQQSPTWPFLLLLAVLMVLTATGPRGWEADARREPLSAVVPPTSGTPLAKKTPARRPPLQRPEAVARRPVPAPIEPRVTEQATAPAWAVDVRDFVELPLEIVTPRITISQSRPMLPLTAPATEAAPPQPAVEGPLLASLPKPQAPPLREPVAAAPPARKPSAPWWPVPARLVSQLHELGKQEACATWSMRADWLIDELTHLDSPIDPRAEEIQLELRSLVASPGNFLSARPAPAVAAQLAIAQHALARRLDVWQHIDDLAVEPDAGPAAPHADRLAMCLSEVESKTGEQEAGGQWRKYLLLDALKGLNEHHDGSVDGQRQLAREILSRLDRKNLTAPQREFITSGPLASLRDELCHWAAEPVDARRLLAHLERYEQTQLPSDAALVASEARQLVDSGRDADTAVARLLDADYRNANVRISLTGDLLNRMVPPQEPRRGRIRDKFMGHPTRGWSTTTTEVAIRLLPDGTHLRMALEARGLTYSETDTSSGPVVVHALSDAGFIAAKEIALSSSGLESSPLEVEAEALPSRLGWVKTDFDSIPFVGTMIRSVAEYQHEDSQAEASWEARRRIVQEVSQKMEAELSKRMERATGRIQQHVMDPLTELGLRPQMIEAQTTDDRLTMRLRLATDRQLAGVGPRPRAPAGCLASVQIHQSAINNLCEQLGWDGKTLSLPHLVADVQRKLHLDLDVDTKHLPADLMVTFASHDAIHVVCEDGRVQLNLAISRLQKSPEIWRDFVVRVYFKPDMTSPYGRLERDGTVELIGHQRPKAQLALRGIFSRAIPKSAGFQVLPKSLVERPNLGDLRLTQFEIRDGWIGVAIAGSQAASQEPTVALKPE